MYNMKIFFPQRNIISSAEDEKTAAHTNKKKDKNSPQEGCAFTASELKELTLIKL